jgi:threonine dehydrogenase-like Zn-dependent dehydrogenase
VVAIHHVPVVIPPFDLLMPEVNVTGVAMSANAFPQVIDAMARGIYPLEEWVETIPFASLLERGMERLRRQEGLKILVDVGSRGVDVGSRG